MPYGIPTWPEITEHEQWGSFNPEEQESYRMKWLDQVGEADPGLSDEDMQEISNRTLEGTGSAPVDEGLRPPVEQPEILPGKQWDYNSETGRAVTREQGGEWADASDEDAELIRRNLPTRTAPTENERKTLEVLGKNQHLNFVQRIINADQAPSIQNEDGTISSHKMAFAETGEGNNKKYVVYPTIIEREGELVELDGQTAMQYASESGEFITFTDPDYAAEFAEGGYKVGMPGYEGEQPAQIQPLEGPKTAAGAALTIGEAGKMTKEQLAQYGMDDPLRMAGEVLAKFAAPLSGIAGAIKEFATLDKNQNRDVTTQVMDSVEAGFNAFSEGLMTGKIITVSDIRKEIQGKTYEEQYGLLWGSLANLAGSSVIDPLMMAGVGLKTVRGLTRAAQGMTKPGKMLKLLDRVKLSANDKAIVSEARKIINSELKQEMKAVQNALPAEKKMIQAGRGMAMPENTFTKGALTTPAPQKITKALKPAKEIALPGAGKKANDAVSKIWKGTDVDVPKMSPVAGTDEAIQGLDQIKTTDDLIGEFVATGGKIKKGKDPSFRRTDVVGKETVDKLQKKQNTNIGEGFVIEKDIRSLPKGAGKELDKAGKEIIEETRNKVRKAGAEELDIPEGALPAEGAIGDTMSDFSVKAAKGNGEGTFLGMNGGAFSRFMENKLTSENLKRLGESVKKGYREGVIGDRGDEFVRRSFLSVEKPFEEIGEAGVGFAVKNQNSRADAVRSRVMDTMKEISAMGKTGWRGLLKPGQKTDKFIKSDLSNIPLAAESDEFFKGLSPATQARIKPAVDRLKKFFVDAKADYAKYGVDVNFKGHMITNMGEENVKITRTLTKIKDRSILKLGKKDMNKLGIDLSDFKGYKPKNMKQARTLLAGQKKANLEAMRQMEKLDYVHIPYLSWFGDANRGSMTRALRIANAHKRKTPSIMDLIEAKAIKKDQANVFDVMSSYGDRMAKDFGMLDIKKAALRSGLISKTKKAGYVKMDGRKAPMFMDTTMHPVFKNWLYEYTEKTYNQSWLDKGFSMAKLAQFTKPAFLGYYNAQQHMAMRGIRVLNLKGVARDVGKAAKMMWTHSDDYYAALDNGLKSTPYDAPWKVGAEMIERFKTTGNWEHLKLGGMQAIRSGGIGNVYKGLWHTAWTLGDEFPRLVSYNFLRRSKNISPHESAQLAALFHSDYASIPVNIRRGLNRVFFTPTFKMTMAKLYNNMLQGAFQVPKKTVQKGLSKATGGRIKPPETITAQEKVLAEGAVNTGLGVMLGGDFVMTKILGYERDQFARRYYKLAKDEDGNVVENVAVFASPLTLIPKYVTKYQEIMSTPRFETTPLGAAYKSFKWELHPVWRALGNLNENKTDANEDIYSVFDHETVAGIKQATYFSKQMVKLWDEVMSAAQPEATSTKKAEKLFRKEVGVVFDKLLDPMTFNYLRGPTFKRARKRMEMKKKDLLYARGKLQKEGDWTQKDVVNFSITMRDKLTVLFKEVMKQEKIFHKHVMSEEIDMGPRYRYSCHIPPISRGDVIWLSESLSK